MADGVCHQTSSSWTWTLISVLLTGLCLCVVSCFPDLDFSPLDDVPGDGDADSDGETESDGDAESPSVPI